MTLIDTHVSTSSAFAVSRRGPSQKWEEIVNNLTLTPNLDPMDVRLGLLAKLRDGWAGLGSVRPRREDINRVYRAMQDLGSLRSFYSLTAQADGTIVLEGEAGGRVVSAELSGDTMFLAVDGTEPAEVTTPFEQETLMRFLERGGFAPH